MTQIPWSNATTAQNTYSVTNSLVLPTIPSTPAQTGWNGEIVAISNTAASTIDANSDSPPIISATDFILLSFGAEDSNSNSIANPPGNPLPVGKTARLTLPVNTALPNTSINSFPYDILFAQANNYFPVATLAGDVSNNASADIVLPMPAPHDSSSAANAYRFFQAFMANPYSPIAQQFTIALANDINAKPVTGSCANVNAFFAESDEYKNVDFTIYSAVCIYAFTYAYIWADFQPNYTYTIYSTTPIDSTDDQDLIAPNVKPSLLGRVVFSQIDRHTPPLADANAGYSITWKPNGGPAVNLHFVQGQLVSQTNSDTDVVCLQMTFVEQGLLVVTASGENQACQALIGMINGVHVVGLSRHQHSPDPDAGHQGDDGIPDTDASVAEGFFASKTVDSITIIIGVICLLGLYLTVRYYRNNRTAELNAETQGEFKQWWEVDNKKWLQEAAERMKNMGEQEFFEQYRREARLLMEQEQKPSYDAAMFPVIVESCDEQQLRLEFGLRQARLEYSEFSQQEEEEADQLNVRSNSSIIAEVKQTNADMEQLRDLDLKSDNANATLANLQTDFNHTQNQILNENKTLRLNSPKQNQLSAIINQDQQQEQIIEDQEEEEKVYTKPNFVEDP